MPGVLKQQGLIVLLGLARYTGAAPIRKAGRLRSEGTRALEATPIRVEEEG